MDKQVELRGADGRSETPQGRRKQYSIYPLAPSIATWTQQCSIILPAIASPFNRQPAKIARPASLSPRCPQVCFHPRAAAKMYHVRGKRPAWHRRFFLFPLENWPNQGEKEGATGKACAKGERRYAIEARRSVLPLRAARLDRCRIEKRRMTQRRFR